MTSTTSSGRAAWTRTLAHAPDFAASVLMVLAFVVFCAMAVLMRLLGTAIPVAEVLLLRQIAALGLMAPWLWRLRGEIGRAGGMKLHLARGVLAAGAMGCGLSATVLLPLADVTAIQMAEVLLSTVLAAAVLREPVGWRRWSAAGVGFAGVAIMVRPFGGGIDAYALVALLGALCGAGGTIALRLGPAFDRTLTVLFWQGLVVIALAAPMALAAWVPPDAAQAAILAGMSLLFAAGQWLITIAMRIGRTAAIAPLGYLRLVMMATLGWALYGEVPAPATALGSALILAAATYTLMRNAARRAA